MTKVRPLIETVALLALWPEVPWYASNIFYNSSQPYAAPTVS